MLEFDTDRGKSETGKDNCKRKKEKRLGDGGKGGGEGVKVNFRSYVSEGKITERHCGVREKSPMVTAQGPSKGLRKGKKRKGEGRNTSENIRQ